MSMSAVFVPARLLGRTKKFSFTMKAVSLISRQTPENLIKNQLFLFAGQIDKAMINFPVLSQAEDKKEMSNVVYHANLKIVTWKKVGPPDSLGFEVDFF